MENPFLPQCRICFESDGELISPCNYISTLKYIHTECLQKWRKTLPFNVFNLIIIVIYNVKYVTIIMSLKIHIKKKL